MPPASSKSARIGVVTATAIVVANIIGTGVFTSLGFQLRELHSGFTLLMLWIVGGVAALCGALCYGELSAALPRSGGEYHFLARIYHPAIGFMAGWISATVGFAAPIALAAMAFGRYFHGTFDAGSPFAISFAVVWLVTLVHLRNLRVGSAFQVVFTSFKVLLIVTLIAAGFMRGAPEPVSFTPVPSAASALFGGGFAVSLVYVMYAYSGWNASAYILNEIRRPEKNVPRSLVLGTGAVTALYVLLNAVFLRTTPASELTGQLEIGLIAGRHIFGEFGGRLMGAFICIGLVSSISSMTWVGPRVSLAMGEDVRLLRPLARQTAAGIPAVAILFQLFVVSLLLWTGSFEIVLVYIQFALLLCSFLAVLGVIVLRRTAPDLPRPYRVWAYPLPPLIFLGITLWMMLYLLHSHTAESLAGLLTMLAGLVLYYCSLGETPKPS